MLAYTNKSIQRSGFIAWSCSALIMLFIYNTAAAQKSFSFKRSSEPTEFASFSKADFSVQVPDYLIEVDDLSKAAELQFKNIFSETYLLIASEEIETTGHGEQLLVMQSLYEAKLQEKGAVLDASRWLTINKHPALQCEVSYVVDGRMLNYLVTFIETPNKLFKIYNWTLAENKTYYSADFRKTALSFNTQTLTGKR